MAKSIEDSIRELEELVGRLEDERTTLEDSFKLYEQGVKMVKNINTRIDKVEKKIEILDTDNTEDCKEE